MTETKVRIVKVGSTPPPPPERKKTRQARQSRVKSGKTFPRGILKKGGTARVKPVRDPAKPPPLKPGRTLRILTEKGAEKRRERIRKTVRSIPAKALRERLQKSGIPVGGKAPDELLRQIAGSAAEAGMVSLG